ncbi:hypothetical protein [Hydrogenophaga sp. BPS33]|uniref:hypothetical protein n=1 Tax=Hydrogenophaga sp. BPS33 TaxID=2651974 RepID=UPI00131FE07D|nr:hypothetical protein [Hydrogenophaga sp. BPS33]QHE85143.1 hypothetical protein F9K07_09715 [Hydrogenophaga sp. BPS33]
MSLIQSLTSPLGLRRVLWADALSGSGTAGLHLALAGSLSPWLGLPTGLLSASGIVLLLYVALAGALALQPTPPRAWLTTLIVGNFAWVAACLVLLFGGVVSPTPLGQAYLVVQAVAVFVLAELQWTALRRTRLATA